MLPDVDPSARFPRSPHRRLREHVELCCAHGDVTSQPLAEVDIEVDGDSFPMAVGVAETLPRSVLLGRDFPWLPRLLATRTQEGGEEALLVMTRERKWREQAEAIRLEALAIKWAMEKLKVYLLGREFVVQTEHAPLQFMERHANNARVARWGLALQPFRF